jgi:hypothetical protein
MKTINIGKYATFQFSSIRELGDWRVWTRCWEINFSPKAKNYYRFFLMTPFVTFYITGWLFWGEPPKEKNV